jgi:hypothetical protein
MQKKRQHVIPECYLKAWCDPATPADYEPYIWIISENGTTKKKRAPRKSFVETEFYTVPLQDGTRNLVIEDSFSLIEDRFARLYREKIGLGADLDQTDRGLLCVFAAMMSSRTKSERRSLTKSFTEMHEMTKALEEQYTPEQHDASNETAAWRDYGHHMSIGHSINFISDALFRMRSSIFIAAQNQRYVTSDCPCGWFNPEAYRWPPFYRSPGLAQERIEITLPLSPTHLAFFSWQELPEVFQNARVDKRSAVPYLAIPDGVVGELNRRACNLSDTLIISQTENTQAPWFEPGELPDDAWDKQHPRPT